VNIAAKAIFFALISAAVASAQTPQQFGAWSVYPATGNLNHTHAVLLQITSHELHNAQGSPVTAKLDVICKRGKVSAIAIETDAEIPKTAMSFSGAIPTAQIAFALEGHSNGSENWAVLDGGHTMSPYSEAFQGKLNRKWIERLTATQKMDVRLDRKASEYEFQPIFNTGGFSQALASVGCTY
jgi:hypothetical protein